MAIRLWVKTSRTNRARPWPAASYLMSAMTAMASPFRKWSGTTAT